MDVSGPPQQSSFNGAPDNLMFSSVILVWPPAPPWLQLSAKTRDLLPLSGGGGCKGSQKKIWTRLWRHHLNLKSFSAPLFSRHCCCIDQQNCWWQLSLWSDEVVLVIIGSRRSCVWNLWVAGSLLSIHHIYRSMPPPTVVLAARPLFKIELLLHAFCNALVLLTLWIKSLKWWINLRQLMQAPKRCHVSVIYSHFKWVKSNQGS